VELIGSEYSVVYGVQWYSVYVGGNGDVDEVGRERNITSRGYKYALGC